MYNNQIHNDRSLEGWITIDQQLINGKYIGFSDDHVGFMESCTSNSKFNNLIYLPIGSKNGELSLYSYDVNSSENSATKVMDIVHPTYGKELTCFGSKITSNGILWLCIFNKNMIVGIDLKNNLPQIDYSIENIPCPNDLCLDPHNEHIIYVAGGLSFRTKVREQSPMFRGDNLTDDVNIPSFGVVYEVRVNFQEPRRSTVKKFLKGLTTLAGINCTHDNLYFTQLYDMKFSSLKTIKAKMLSTNFASENHVVWEGTRIDNPETCYLCDNVSLWSDKIICTAIYREIDADYIRSLKSRSMSCAGWFLAKSATILYEGCCHCQWTSFADPEVLLQFSTQDTFHPCCFALYDEEKKRNWNFKFSPLRQDGIDFDGHCTHVQHHGNKIIFINFKSNHFFVMNDDPVVALMSGSEA